MKIIWLCMVSAIIAVKAQYHYSAIKNNVRVNLNDGWDNDEEDDETDSIEEKNDANNENDDDSDDSEDTRESSSSVRMVEPIRSGTHIAVQSTLQREADKPGVARSRYYVVDDAGYGYYGTGDVKVGNVPAPDKPQEGPSFGPSFYTAPLGTGQRNNRPILGKILMKPESLDPHCSNRINRPERGPTCIVDGGVCKTNKCCCSKVCKCPPTRGFGTCDIMTKK